MALSTGSLPSLGAPAIPHLNFRRDYNVSEPERTRSGFYESIGTPDGINLTCTLREEFLTPERRLRNDTYPSCPGDEAVEQALVKCAAVEPIFSDKEACREVCELLIDQERPVYGSVFNETVHCLEEQCSEGPFDKNNGSPQVAWAIAKFGGYEHNCENLGYSVWTKYNSEAVGAGAKKGLLVMAVLFGSVFSGLL
ncbi:hypothetical protein BJ508DRAFT_418795, partial [Ascobolus immersus RN42]